ncbi:ABC transporter ATP-binding protein [Mucilaginibacter gotjawali]|uniref:ABC-2 type transport system ATP-binding protein n=2 Tax=Mucilaginibacter gotjawali TaxID=1550579 RepID=A0A839SB43_9SPHI|nr:ABC transporter ATP-binding protein [Mucilaginibacter gotjawali]MBB3053807.1 ABC-2 type transport system ATP-binding protein [Mucilaginibacter gotjawali]BAU54069.1 putative ABC transporter ATP-binding protein YxlF [Mucilaginibacter gotjawali]
MNSILKIEQLSHKYTSSWAIRDINMEIAQNGIVGLLGSNGAGKSTTMNIICGVLNHTEGDVYINGFDIRTQAESAKKEIGFLPQIPPLYTDLTVDEYLRYCAELRFIENGKIKSAVEEVKERCGIAHFSNRLIRNLSGGYRQRVGIAQAIIHKPKLVVMDEPTNGLDPNQLIEVRKLIKEIALDHAVLLSSHILSEIHILCKEIIMIEGGRLVFADTMDAFDNYMPSNSLMMRMENPPPIGDILNIQGVTRAELLTDKQVRVYFEGGEEITERLVVAGVQQNWQLREISLEKGQLDDIFKTLSSPQPNS